MTVETPTWLEMERDMQSHQSLIAGSEAWEFSDNQLLTAVEACEFLSESPVESSVLFIPYD